MLLSAADAAATDAIGSKAAGLARLLQAGLPVPAGLVLTTEFFEPWSQAIEQLDIWQAALAQVRHFGMAAAGERHQSLAMLCGELQRAAQALPIAPAQRVRIDALQAAIGPGPYAVRSSSPREDLPAASFAGLYVTQLNVQQTGLVEAIRCCFCGCLDARVLLYQAGMSTPEFAPRLAVIVQQMVASEVSGVAFSINPASNDFDELAINASWGLGAALVNGELTPDSIVVDKVSGRVRNYRLGSKGGERPDEPSLSTAQLFVLASLVARVEALFAAPVDVEWTFAGSQPYLLQARPITAYVPLHPSLVSAPGAPRRLYVDGHLSDGITMSTATTPMSNDVFVRIIERITGWVLNVAPSPAGFAAYGLHTATGRLYIDVSMYLHLLGSGAAIAAQTAAMNPLVTALLTAPELSRYRPASVPRQHRLWYLLRYLPGVLWRCRAAFVVLLAPMFAPARFAARATRAVAAFEGFIAQPIPATQSLSAYLDEALTRAGNTILASSYPAFVYAYQTGERLKRLADPAAADQLAWVDAICNGHEDELVVGMGLALFDLSQALPACEFDDLPLLAQKLSRRQLPDDLLTLWDDFVARYGCRGPLEMELANPKYQDDPLLAVRQMAGLAAGAATFNPHDMQRAQVRRRQQAFQSLHQALSPRRARALTRFHAVGQKHGAAREMFKHHIMQLYWQIRARLLTLGTDFVGAGRLQHRDQIFELTLAEVDRAVVESAFDLQAAVAASGAHYRKLKRHVRHFPLAIDSRGRILKPPVRHLDGALLGVAVSAGVARGPVKVLNDPFEKPVLPGDVLVAVTTDPGWTPLFISAAAIVLEIGGELQHGALVAREYGKPCVSGIPEVTTQFADGQMVEVDGNTGVVRLLDAPPPVEDNTAGVRRNQSSYQEGSS